MTRAELRTEFHDRMAEVSGKKTWETTVVDRWLLRSLRKLQRKFGTYPKSKAVRILASRNEYPQSTVLPTLAAGEVQEKLWSVEFQRGSNGAITAIATANGNGRIASAQSSLVTTGARLQLLNMTSGNYENKTYIGGAWDSSYFYVVDLDETVTGTVTSVTDSTGDAVFNLASHPFSDNEIVRLSGGDVYTEALYTLTTVDGDSFTLADVDGNTVAYSATDTPVITRVVQYDTSTDTGVFVVESMYPRRTLSKAPWSDVKGWFNNYVDPSVGEVPLGTAFLNWWVISASIADGELSDLVFPEAHQDIIAVDAAVSALVASGDDRLVATIQSELAGMMSDLSVWSKQMNPREEAFAGRFYGINGLYGYRPQTDRAFVIAPGDD